MTKTAKTQEKAPTSVEILKAMGEFYTRLGFNEATRPKAQTTLIKTDNLMEPLKTDVKKYTGVLLGSTADVPGIVKAQFTYNNDQVTFKGFSFGELALVEGVPMYIIGNKFIIPVTQALLDDVNCTQITSQIKNVTYYNYRLRGNKCERFLTCDVMAVDNTEDHDPDSFLVLENLFDLLAEYKFQLKHLDPGTYSVENFTYDDQKKTYTLTIGGRLYFGKEKFHTQLIELQKAQKPCNIIVEPIPDDGSYQPIYVEGYKPKKFVKSIKIRDYAASLGIVPDFTDKEPGTTIRLKDALKLRLTDLIEDTYEWQGKKIESTVVSVYRVGDPEKTMVHLQANNPIKKKLDILRLRKGESYEESEFYITIYAIAKSQLTDSNGVNHLEFKISFDVPPEKSVSSEAFLNALAFNS